MTLNQRHVINLSKYMIRRDPVAMHFFAQMPILLMIIIAIVLKNCTKMKSPDIQRKLGREMNTFVHFGIIRDHHCL